METTWKTTRRLWCVVVSCALSGLVSSYAAELPDSPGTIATQQTAVTQQNDLTAAESSEITLAQATTPPAAAQQQSGQSSTSSQSSSSNQSGSNQAGSNQANSGQANSGQGEAQPPGQKPVGTAAAGSVPTTGVAASQPAGNAIAPGKQRRVRSLVLKTGAIIAAGVAIGTVAGLTLATSSKPPGAH
jgi:cobalamin biosynthesis Mg chelatase CobN